MSSSSHQHNNMTMIDLFAGAGGLSCGFEQAGFTPVLANEISPVYANTYAKNHPNTQVIVGDICNYGGTIFSKFTGVDIIIGGPPCQGFSINAPIRTLDDPRNHLFREYIRIVKIIKPRAVVIENVPGIIQLGHGTIVQQIYYELQKLNYTVSHKILYAGHYGVPQTRFRTVFIGIHNTNKYIEFPEPEYYSTARANFFGSKKYCIPLAELSKVTLKKSTTVHDAISDLPFILDTEKQGIFDYNNEPESDYQRMLRIGSSKITNHYCKSLSPINRERLKYIKQNGNWTDIPHDLLPEGMKRARKSDHTKRYGRLANNSIASTILTKCDPHWGCFFHPEQERVISVREAARLQSFPDKYVFTGNITQQYEQVGNAVPPLLAKAIGHSIMNMLE